MPPPSPLHTQTHPSYLERPARLLDHVDGVQVALALQPQDGVHRQRREVALVAAEDLGREGRAGHVGAGIVLFVGLFVRFVCLVGFFAVLCVDSWISLFCFVCGFSRCVLASKPTAGKRGKEETQPTQNTRQKDSQVPLERDLVPAVVERARRQRRFRGLRCLAVARDHRGRVDLSIAGRGVCVCLFVWLWTFVCVVVVVVGLCKSRAGGCGFLPRFCGPGFADGPPKNAPWRPRGPRPRAAARRPAPPRWWCRRRPRHPGRGRCLLVVL